MENEPIKKTPWKYIVGGVALLVICLFVYMFLISPPSRYPTGTVVVIQPGSTLSRVTVQLRNMGAVRSSATFQIFALLFGSERKIIAGDYLLGKPENVLRLAWRVSRGSFGMQEIKVTIPEGFTVAQIADTLSHKMSGISREEFIRLAQKNEGYLFPDTYFFVPSATSTQIVSRMKTNFTNKIASLGPAIAGSGYSTEEIVTIASIIEGEATSTIDRQIVSGILFTRLNRGLLLQMDSTLKYVTGRGSKDLTMADLQSSSPYNTYRYKGLPPTPINNPGLDSIKAALNPVSTEYVYFLTGKDGGMHYAKTFEEHKKNIEKYL